MLAGSISIKDVAKVVVEQPKLDAEVKHLTQEDLERIWQETAEELNLQNLMKDGVVKLSEKIGVFEVEAQTTWFHDDFKPHKLEVLTAMRRKANMPMLDCKVNPLFVDKDEIIYSPEQKYNAMLEHNHDLMSLRRMFPNIDY